MNQIKRRQFIQFAGGVLATVGLNQINPWQEKKFIASATENTPRKLALLVGINRYSESDSLVQLKGAVTDVELQKQLLIYRFGFQPKDILILTDDRATRQGILKAFEDHLIRQAQPNDVVVFHFSGQGDRILDPNSTVPDRFSNSLVPVDRFPNADGEVSDITESTLWLLMAGINTEKVTIVLDTSFYGRISRGGLGIISNSTSGKYQVSREEKAYQDKWLTRLGLSRTEFIQQQNTGIYKGIMISGGDQLTTDILFRDVYAGAFTYWMTQYLWQEIGNERVESAVINITRGLKRWSSQVPKLFVKPNSGNKDQPTYFIVPQTPPAEAVITKVTGSLVELWLGGINPETLPAFEQGAILTIVDNDGNKEGLVELISRQGLVGKGKVIEASSNGVKSGVLLQERIRGIPDNLTLRIGIDPSLARDKVAVVGAFQAIKGIEIIEEGEIDYILSRMTNSYQQELQEREDNQQRGSNKPQSHKSSLLEKPDFSATSIFSLNFSSLPTVGSIGLFSPEIDVVANSFGLENETVTDAIARLITKLKSLLAVRLVKLALNPNSSQLNAIANMTLEGQEGSVIGEVGTLRCPSSNLTKQAGIRQEKQLRCPSYNDIGNLNSDASGRESYHNNIPAIPLGTHLQFHITNNEINDIYCCIIVIDSNTEMTVLFPNQWTAAEDVMRVKVEETLHIPNLNQDDFALITQAPVGIVEVLIIASSKPLQNTLKVLRTIASSRGQRGGFITVNATNEPTDIVSNLLNDLDGGDRANRSHSNIYQLDATQLAVMSISLEVI
jgi:hypothetical protein